jgi:hypothetical protein
MPEDGQDIQPHQPNYRIPNHPEKTSFPRNDRLNPPESVPPHRKPRAGLPKNTALPQRSRRDPLQIHQVSSARIDHKDAPLAAVHWAQQWEHLVKMT